MARNSDVLIVGLGRFGSACADSLTRLGHDVIGVTLNVWPESSSSGGASAKACCGNSAVEDARRVAGRLGIPYYVLNFKDLFRRRVIDDFVAEYRRGRTPNPCVRCNERVKFQAVLERALDLGFDALATGHYARIEGAELHRAADAAKDQSYVLAVLEPWQIERAILPLARETVESRARELADGTIGLEDYQSSEDDLADVTASLRDALLRHRRSMLDLNTAVGLRILP